MAGEPSTSIYRKRIVQANGGGRFQAPPETPATTIDRIAAGLFRECVRTYEGHPGRKSLIDLLQFASTHYLSSDHHIWTVISALQECASNPCGKVVCPECVRRLKKRESYSILKAVVARLQCTPTPSLAAFITINGPSVADISNVEALHRASLSFKRRLRDVRRRQLPTTAWAGHVELSLDGQWHYHAIGLFPDQNIEPQVRLLRGAFGGRESVVWKRWHEDEPLSESIVGVASYFSKGRPKLNGKRHFEELASAALQLTRWIAAWDQYGYASYVGSRLHMNMRSDWSWRDTFLISRVTGEVREFAEMTQLMLSRRNGGGEPRTLVGTPWLRP